jgi:hypothetical protein
VCPSAIPLDNRALCVWADHYLEVLIRSDLETRALAAANLREHARRDQHWRPIIRRVKQRADAAIAELELEWFGDDAEEAMNILRSLKAILEHR